MAEGEKGRGFQSISGSLLALRLQPRDGEREGGRQLDRKRRGEGFQAGRGG